MARVLRGAGLASTVLGGAAATKPALLAAMAGAPIVHLATHGAADRVWLAGPDEAGGSLAMAEVQALRLPRTQIVVLSECESFCPPENHIYVGGRSVATVKELRSDGVVGITRSFMAAGAHTTVASLWKVDDAATLELMTRFYEGMFLVPAEAAEASAVGGNGGGTIDVAAAMQVAMRSMIGGAYTPLQWAAFVVYGLGALTLTDHIP